MKKYLLVVISLVLVLTGCGEGTDVFTALNSSPVESLDPAMNSTLQSHQLMADIYVGATRITGDNEQINLGAKSIDVSNDGLIYTLELRDDLVWVDDQGQEMGPVTANDYVFGYQRMVDPNVASVYSYIFENLENANAIITGEKEVTTLGVTALDDYALEIKLDNPVPYFTNLLAFGSYVAQPKGAYELYGEEYATSAETMWYDGPYYVTDFDPDYVISLSKNPLYFDQENVEVARLDYRVNTDDTSRLNAFINGEASYAELDTVENYKAAKEEGIVSERPTMFSYYFVLNTDSSSPTANPDLRQALSVGFDRETVVNSVYEGMNTPIEYIIPGQLTTASYDGLDYRTVAGETLTTYDPDLANKYFDKYMETMGYTDRSQIELSYLLNGDSSDQAFSEVVQAFYKEQYGITINIDATTGGDYKEKRANGGFDILLTDWAPDYGDPSTYLALWKTSSIGSQNYALYANPEYDKLYDEANKQTDPQTRFEGFAKCEQKLVDDGVLVPLYQKNQAYIIDPTYSYPEYVIFLISHQYLTTVN